MTSPHETDAGAPCPECGGLRPAPRYVHLSSHGSRRCGHSFHQPAPAPSGTGEARTCIDCGMPMLNAPTPPGYVACPNEACYSYLVAKDPTQLPAPAVSEQPSCTTCIGDGLWIPPGGKTLVPCPECRPAVSEQRTGVETTGWRALVASIFPNSRTMTHEERAAFDASAWGDAEQRTGPSINSPETDSSLIVDPAEQHTGEPEWRTTQRAVQAAFVSGIAFANGWGAVGVTERAAGWRYAEAMTLGPALLTALRRASQGGTDR